MNRLLLIFAGYGVYTWDDGDRYEGQWVAGRQEGHGSYIWGNGSSYIGQWKEDRRCGIGKYTWPQGDVYEGEFLDSHRHGLGTYTWPDGRKYTGYENNFPCELFFFFLGSGYARGVSYANCCAESGVVVPATGGARTGGPTAAPTSESGATANATELASSSGHQESNGRESGRTTCGSGLRRITSPGTASSGRRSTRCVEPCLITWPIILPSSSAARSMSASEARRLLPAQFCCCVLYNRST